MSAVARSESFQQALLVAAVVGDSTPACDEVLDLAEEIGGLLDQFKAARCRGAEP